MKLIISPLSAGLAPMFKENILDIQDQAHAASLAIVQGLVSQETGVVISGLEVTSINTGASTINLSAGYAYLNGKMIKCNGYSGSYPFYISEGSPNVTNQVWKDGNAHPYYSESTVAFTTTDPGAVQKIAFNPFTSQYLSDVLKRKTTKTGEIVSFLGATSRNGIPLFDATGLGLFDWKGFAFANGQNGTVNLKGKFIAGFDPADSDYASIGSTGGEKRHQLTVNEIPNLPITGKKLQYSGGGSFITVLDTDFTGTPLSNDDKATKGVSTLPAAHENRPPFFTAVYIQKL